MTTMIQRGVHLAAVLFLLFLSFPAKRGKAGSVKWYDMLFAVLAAVSVGYVALNHQAIANRFGAVTHLEVWLGWIAVILLIEAVRRTVGWALAIIVAFTIVYGFVGPYMPGLLVHRGYSAERILSHLYLADTGMFGTPLGVSATIIILFTIFGAFLTTTGVGDTFIESAMAVFGNKRGGPAYAAIMGSALVGSVNGSAAANVVTTGTFTIPLMKRMGYGTNFAGAVESVASTGGQLMPPIMGAAAFIMADTLEIPYLRVALGAAIPSLLYYLSLMFMVYFEAINKNLAPISTDKLPNLKRTLMEKFHVVLPFILFMYLLFRGYSAMFTAFWSTTLLVAVCMLRSNTRINFVDFIKALIQGVSNVLVVAVACAAAGIAIGMFSLTGLAVKFSTLLVTLSGGHLIGLLPLAMVASLLLGMGLPAVACYVILAAVAAPSMVHLGVQPLAAHLFAFYFGIICCITPPVALASYAACGISGGDFNKTGFLAFKLGFAGFIVPYMFVFGPQLLGYGRVGVILLGLASSILGILSLAASLQGFFVQKCYVPERVVLAIAALMLIKPGKFTDIIGFAIVAIVFMIQLARKKRKGLSEVSVSL